MLKMYINDIQWLGCVNTQFVLNFDHNISQRFETTGT